MSVNADFKELLKTLNSSRVEYLLVGAHAVMHYAEPRYTKDIDIWVRPTPENAKRTWEALTKFGAPLEQVTLSDFSNQRMVYQIGVPPNRIDVMMGLPGVRFDTAWKRRVESAYGGVRVQIISRADLIRAKRTAARPQDLLDVSALQQSRPKRKGSR